MNVKSIPVMLMFLSAGAYGQTSISPARLTQATECMLKVLKVTPGVSEPKLGEATSSGTMAPFLEYRAAEATRWVQPTRFTFQQSSKGVIWFQTMLPGAMPSGSHPDLHVTDVVVKKWQLQCGVLASVLLE